MGRLLPFAAHGGKLIHEPCKRSGIKSSEGGEATLTAQAIALDAIFNALAKRAALNMGEYMEACETYLRMALKAQAQCRATLETLAEVKYPKAATFVRQQNVAYQQQVNNSIPPLGNNETSTRPPARAEQSANQSNELLSKATHAPMDTSRTGTAGSAHTQLAAMETVNRG